MQWYGDLRTPKTSEQTHWWEALRANWAESTLALLGFIAIGAALTKTNQLSGPLLAGLLLFPTLGLAAAPVNSWAARRAALPAWLRERRTTEYRRDSVPLAVHLPVRHDHSHHLAIGLADHEYVHPEFVPEFAGHPVRLRDADLVPDPDRNHPVTAWRKSHRAKLSTGSASDSGTACDD